VREARLIAFTAYSGIERQVRAAGFEDYLLKPMDVGRLVTVVESATH
jgi:CheY-like chemotaxis protein